MRAQRGTGKSRALRELAAIFGRDALLVVRDRSRIPAPPAIRMLTFEEVVTFEKTAGLSPSIVLIDDADEFIRSARLHKERADALEREIADLKQRVKAAL